MTATSKPGSNVGVWIACALYWGGIFITGGAIYFATPHLISQSDHHKMAADVLAFGAVLFVIVAAIWKGLGALFRVPLDDEPRREPRAD